MFAIRASALACWFTAAAAAPIQFIPMDEIDPFWYIQPWVHLDCSRFYSSQYDAAIQSGTTPLTMEQVAAQHHAANPHCARNPTMVTLPSPMYGPQHRNGGIEHAVERLFSFAACNSNQTFQNATTQSFQHDRFIHM